MKYLLWWEAEQNNQTIVCITKKKNVKVLVKLHLSLALIHA